MKNILCSFFMHVATIAVLTEKLLTKKEANDIYEIAVNQ